MITGNQTPKIGKSAGWPGISKPRLIAAKQTSPIALPIALSLCRSNRYCVCLPTYPAQPKHILSVFLLAWSCVKRWAADPPHLPRCLLLNISSPSRVLKQCAPLSPLNYPEHLSPQGLMSLEGFRQKEAVCQLGVISRDTPRSLWQDRVLNERGRQKRSGEGLG